VAAGVPDELYWRLTPVETGALLDEIIGREMGRERAASYRAAFLVSELRNVHRQKRSDRVWTPEDFLKDEAAAGPLLGPEHLAGAMDGFAERHNRRVRKARA
jgi:hypothetical protein